MNQITLSKLEIRNFKGIKEFTMDIKGKNADIFGENGTGKTTLNDAFLWTLFNKDSANRSDFSIKPQDKDGNDVHYLETDVMLELLVNGQSKTLRKMLVEKWTKKRGEADKEFTGHETSYWIDTVPVKLKEYQSMINSIIDETAFKLLTNPFYFCTQLKWEDRRKTLMEICGDVSDAEVIDSVVTVSDKSMLDLLNIIDSGRTINDHKKIIAEKIKMLNKQIEDIPIRISEQSRKLTTNEEVDYEVVEAELFGYKATLAKIEQSMMDAGKVASVYRQKQQDEYKLTTAMEDRKKELDESAMAGLKRATDEKVKLEGEKYRLTTEISLLKNKLESKSNEVKSTTTKIEELRVQWQLENQKQFIEPDPDLFICPTCEQSLPAEKMQEKIALMRSNFENNKARVIAEINTDGKAKAEKNKLIGVEIEGIGNQLESIDAKLAEITEAIAGIDKELDAERQRTYSADYEADIKYAGLKSQLDVIKDELNRPIGDTSVELLKRKNEVSGHINSLNKLLNNRDAATKTKERINELKDEERTLASQLSQFEGQKFLIERFIKAKVNLLEDTINNRFQLVKWKLFKTNINGGIEEVCEAMVNGISFNSNLNHAARVNAGIDIINVLAGHYGVTAPIFIDFRESVSRIIETGSQVINLIKSERDKVLRVVAE